MGRALQYKLEVYCQYLSHKLYRLGVPVQCPEFAGSEKLGLAPKVLQNLWGSV